MPAALPGAPRHEGGSVEAIYERAFADAEAYLAGGCDGLIIENHGDVPFSKPDDIGPETAAHMAVAADRIRRRFTPRIGINVPGLRGSHGARHGQRRGRDLRAGAPVEPTPTSRIRIVEGEAARAMRCRARLGAR